MKVMSTAAVAALEARAVRAEAGLESAQARIADADARFDALLEKYTALQEKGFHLPVSMPTPSPEPSASLPRQIQDELDEFRADPELYQHNRTWATAELAKGADEAVVASTIKYGVHSGVNVGVHSPVIG